MKRVLLLIIIVSLAGFVHAQVIVTNLTVEGRRMPIGIDETTPRFGWVIETEEQNVIQTAYHIQVSTSTHGKPNAWDGKVVKSDQSQWVSYQGALLHPNTVYYWRVRVITNKGASEWSDWSQWSTGLFSDNNWKGAWIGTEELLADDSDEQHSRCTARYLRKEFSAKTGVRRATVHVSGLGYYTLYINGKKVGKDRLTPAPTDYTKTVAYNTYDVTSLLQRQNAIGAVVEAGYYFAPAQHFQTNVRTTYGTPRMRLYLIVEYQDGTIDTLVSDGTWKMHTDGAIRYSNIYDGELFDSRKDFGTWTEAGYDDSSWTNANIVKAPGGRMRGNVTEPVRVYEKDKPISIRKYGNRYILDFGTNSAGVIRMRIHAGNGDTIRIRHAETLKTQDSLYLDNLRTAEATAWYIANGKENLWNPEFTWFGFRYAEVIGVKDLQLEDVERLLLSDDLSAEGNSIRIKGCETLNTIIQAAYRGIRSNYKGIPMDCPQRDERMPWLGDRTMGCFGESYVLDVHSLYAKWLNDILESQREDGALSDVAPAYWRLYNHNVTWPAALAFACEMVRRQYGDEQPMETSRVAINRWLRYVKEKSYKEGLITYDRYGDWCVPPEALDVVLTKDSTRMTDGKLLSSCYYYYIRIFF